MRKLYSEYRPKLTNIRFQFSLYVHRIASLRRCFFPLGKDIQKETDLRNPANIYLFKVSNRNTRKKCEICSKLTIKTPEQRH